MDEEELDKALEPLRELLSRRKAKSFKRDLTYTTKTNQTMEVHLMASFDFESLKKKVSTTFGTVVDKTTAFAKDVADKSSDAAKTMAGKAQNAGRKTKLNVEIASARNGVKEKYTELGRLYYEKYAGNTDPDFAEVTAAIESALALIEAKQAEIEALQEEPEEEPAAPAEEPAEEAEHVVDEVEETVEAAAEQAAVVAEEVAEEAKKEFDAAVETVKEETRE